MPRRTLVRAVVGGVVTEGRDSLVADIGVEHGDDLAGESLAVDDDEAIHVSVGAVAQPQAQVTAADLECAEAGLGRRREPEPSFDDADVVARTLRSDVDRRRRRWPMEDALGEKHNQPGQQDASCLVFASASVSARPSRGWPFCGPPF